jgi:hypothetical protein
MLLLRRKNLRTATKDKTELDIQLDAQMQDLYARALDGDIRAKTLWFDLTEKEQNKETFNIEVNIVPYRISDPSLCNILQNADAQVVADALKGLTLRMKSDGFDPLLLNQWENLQPEIFIWLEELERPDDETN